MARGKLLKRKSSGCCWRKLLGRALKKDANVLGRSNIMSHSHQCFDENEIVYLNLYLTSLEKKVQAIEEITRLKWYGHRMRRATGDAQDCIRNGFQYFKEGACDKTLLPTTDGYPSELGNYSGALRKTEILGGDSETIIREIISLGTKNYPQEYSSRKWAELIAPKQDLTARIEPDKSEVNPDLVEEELTSKVHYSVIGIYHVGATCYPTEIHVATKQEENAIPTPAVKASCSIILFDNEAGTIEIAYDNREWGKKGTIVLRDIENQIGVQTELIGRVVCFLLGMGEIDLV